MYEDKTTHHPAEAPTVHRSAPERVAVSALERWDARDAWREMRKAVEKTGRRAPVLFNTPTASQIFTLGWAAAARAGADYPPLRNAPVAVDSVTEALDSFTEKVAPAVLGRMVRYHGSHSCEYGRSLYVTEVTYTTDAYGNAETRYSLSSAFPAVGKPLLSGVRASSVTLLPRH